MTFPRTLGHETLLSEKGNDKLSFRVEIDKHGLMF